MCVEPIHPMSEMSFSPASAQRKVVALMAAAALVVSLGLAFVLGGKKTVVAKSDAQDTQIGTLTNLAALDLSAQATPGDWFDSVPDGADASAKPTVETSSTVVSSVVTGDSPTATKPAPATSPGSEANPPTVASADTSKHSSDAGSAPKALVVAVAKPAQVIPNQTDIPDTSASTADKPSKAATQSHQDSKPVFVTPVRKQAGLIAQTRTLITEEQFHPTKPARNEKAEMQPSNGRQQPAVAAEEPVTKAIPVHVLHEEARSFAAQISAQLRQQGTLKLGERIRLPRGTETPSKKIWREDDKPVVSGERRPFGLVLTQESSAFTPAGIPLRTDIPAGKSPLEKTGADKPLWKKPE